ncbi:hypothetical protein LXL04_026274 [Taraxacum kok-saghyz]
MSPKSPVLVPKRSTSMPEIGSECNIALTRGLRVKLGISEICLEEIIWDSEIHSNIACDSDTPPNWESWDDIKEANSPFGEDDEIAGPFPFTISLNILLANSARKQRKSEALFFFRETKIAKAREKKTALEISALEKQFRVVKVSKNKKKSSGGGAGWGLVYLAPTRTRVKTSALCGSNLQTSEEEDVNLTIFGEGEMLREKVKDAIIVIDEWSWEAIIGGDNVGYGVQDSTHWYDFMNKVKVLLGLPSGTNRIMKRLMRESSYKCLCAKNMIIELGLVFQNLKLANEMNVLAIWNNIGHS